MGKISCVIAEWFRCNHVAPRPKEKRKIELIGLSLRDNASVSFNFDLECRLFSHQTLMECLHEKRASEHEDRSH